MAAAGPGSGRLQANPGPARLGPELFRGISSSRAPVAPTRLICFEKIDYFLRVDRETRI
jgi:hypothetical protein